MLKNYLKSVGSVCINDNTFPVYGSKKDPLFCVTDVVYLLEQKYPSERSACAHIDESKKGIFILERGSSLSRRYCLNKEGLRELLTRSHKRESFKALEDFDAIFCNRTACIGKESRRNKSFQRNSADFDLCFMEEMK